MQLDLAQILAVQCPLPGQPGAPLFDGKDVTLLLRRWERFSGNYQFTEDSKLADVIDYCEPGIGKYVETLIKVTKAKMACIGSTGVAARAEWESFQKLLLKKFKKDDLQQHRVAVPFLRDLAKDKSFCTDAEDVERYIYQFQEISDSLVKDSVLTVFKHLVLFLQGLPDGMTARIYSQTKLDVDDPSSFVRKGYFEEAIEAALTLNRTTTGISRLQSLGLDQGDPLIKSIRQIQQNKTREAKGTAIIAEPVVNPKPTDVTWEQKVADLEKEMLEMRL
jgi:hypothetical protein